MALAKVACNTKATYMSESGKKICILLEHILEEAKRTTKAITQLTELLAKEEEYDDEYVPDEEEDGLSDEETEVPQVSKNKISKIRIEEEIEKQIQKRLPQTETRSGRFPQINDNKMVGHDDSKHNSNDTTKSTNEHSASRRTSDNVENISGSNGQRNGGLSIQLSDNGPKSDDNGNGPKVRSSGQ